MKQRKAKLAGWADALGPFGFYVCLGGFNVLPRCSVIKVLEDLDICNSLDNILSINM